MKDIRYWVSKVLSPEQTGEKQPEPKHSLKERLQYEQEQKKQKQVQKAPKQKKQDITSNDDMELGKLGERKQAIFCIIPDSNDASLNFLVGMLYTQAFQELYYQADKVHHGALPVPVRLMFDEFANVALPDGYARLQATMRSRNIMSTIILQNISQLKALFTAWSQQRRGKHKYVSP